MKVSHRALADVSAPLTSSAEPTADLSAEPSFDKAPRLSCCCRLSELLPKVRQLHDAIRATHLAGEDTPGVAA